MAPPNGGQGKTTIDWIEEATGAPRQDACEVFGHDKVRISEAREVHGHPAAHFVCHRCGRKGFHWIPRPAPSPRLL